MKHLKKTSEHMQAVLEDMAFERPEVGHSLHDGNEGPHDIAAIDYEQCLLYDKNGKAYRWELVTYIPF